ncbi:hypothetical protein [Floridanema aerugineum]|uniref:DUF2281 domain-containing protein n=1 Tax=Floridaenema aerugineum BLCC-F46 TaxID=3153654 RepID=A0ABV4X0F4_9CYAN
MQFLKQKIAENLERLPEGELQKVLDFVDFLVWRNSKRKDTISPEKDSNLESSAIDDSMVHYVEGVLVVKAASREAGEEVKWENLVPEMREERIRKFMP